LSGDLPDVTEALRLQLQSKPLKGFGGVSAMEIVASSTAIQTARGVYGPLSRVRLPTTRFPEETPSRASPPRRRTSTSFINGWQPQNETTKKGRKSMKIKRKTAKSANVTDEGTGNVFADLGLPNADQELMKAHLTQALLLFGKDLGRT
jgi:hypothetical protein